MDELFEAGKTMGELGWTANKVEGFYDEEV